MQIALSVNPNNPDISFNVDKLNELLAAGWKVINGFSSTMQAVIVILEKPEE